VSTDSTDQLSLTFAALADPTRRAILTLLAEGEATVNEVAAGFPISVPAISRHLKVLERAGLITRSREAQWRRNRLQPEPFDDAVVWMQSRTRTWQARMDRLEAHLRRHVDPDQRGARDERADPHHD
jgi:DNA-binding transcriptional ArsR family regulator